MKERSIHWRSIHWLSALVATGGMLAAFAEPATAGDPSRSGVSKHHRAEPRLDAIERLGQKIFFDTDLSINENQSCAACHLREVGWTGPDPEINLGGAVYEGSIHGRFGNRKPPTSAYATYAPLFAWDAAEALFVGGNFWDGRATGWQLGNPAADQAQGPFLNPVEQALPNPASVLARVCASEYAQLFRRVWGASACRNVERGYGAIARSVAAYEGSRAVSEFTSKYDAVLAGRARFTEREALGLELFQGKALCANCHTDVAASGAPRALFTDFTYDNIGTPRNPANPFYEMDDVFVDGVPLNPDGADWVDPGLGGFVASLAESDAWRDEPYVTEPLRSMTSQELASLAEQTFGQHKVPTLRNVDRRPHPHFPKAYMHNGYFKTLRGVVHFYNTRDVLPACDGDLTEAEALAENCWPAPEVSENLNVLEVGDLGLTEAEEGALVAFMETLSDGWPWHGFQSRP